MGSSASVSSAVDDGIKQSQSKVLLSHKRNKHKYEIECEQEQVLVQRGLKPAVGVTPVSQLFGNSENKYRNSSDLEEHNSSACAAAATAAVGSPSLSLYANGSMKNIDQVDAKNAITTENNDGSAQCFDPLYLSSSSSSDKLMPLVHLQPMHITDSSNNNYNYANFNDTNTNNTQLPIIGSIYANAASQTGSFTKHRSQLASNKSFLSTISQHPNNNTHSNSGGSVEIAEIKEKMYPKSLKSVKSLRSLALQNHAKQENHYIPMERGSLLGLASILTLSESGNTFEMAPSLQKTAHKGTINNNTSSNANNRSSLPKKASNGSNHSSSGGSLVPSNNNSGGNLKPQLTVTVSNNNSNNVSNAMTGVNNNAGNTVPGMKKRLNLRINIQDDQDWIQVSDDEGGDDENGETPRRKRELLLPLQIATNNNNPTNVVNTRVMNPQQSYLFTQSGTIFVDGFKEGIRHDGLSVMPSLSPIQSPSNANNNNRNNNNSNNNIMDAMADQLGTTTLQCESTSQKSNNSTTKVTMKERLVILCRLGQGASSVVYKALDLLYMRIVAVKMIPILLERGRRRQMARELSGLFDILHRKVEQQSVETPEMPYKDCIVDFYDAFSNVDEGGVGLMIEYMDGGSLQDMIDNNTDGTSGGCDDETTLAHIAWQAVQGLSFLHNTCNILHRDLKPSNFLISHTGDVKIADLGIMKQLESQNNEPVIVGPTIFNENYNNNNNNNNNDHINDKTDSYNNNNSNNNTETIPENSPSPLPLIPTLSYTLKPSIPRTHTFVGTATYMSPERLDGKEYSYPSDIWALGLSLMAIAMGKLPFDTQGGYWTIIQHIRDEPIVPKLPSSFSPLFRDFLSSCLHRKPANRLTCDQLLLHPFIASAKAASNTLIAVSSSLEFGDGDLRGVFELHSILQAALQHTERMLDNYNSNNNASNNNTTNNANNHSLLISPIFGDIPQLVSETPGNGLKLKLSLVKTLMHRAFFGLIPEDANSNSNNNRLTRLAKQLYIDLEIAAQEVKAFIDGIHVDVGTGEITPALRS